MTEETNGGGSSVRRDQAAKQAGLSVLVEGLRRDLDKLEVSCTSGHESVDDQTQRELDEIRAFLWPSSGPTLREQLTAGDSANEKTIDDANAKLEKLVSNIRVLGGAGFVLLALIQIAIAILRVVL